MAQIVERPRLPLDAGCRQGRPERSREPALVEWRAELGMREHVVGVALVRAGLVQPHQVVDEGSGERDQALPLLRLTLLNAERALDEVDVPPPKGLQLEPSDAGQDEGDERDTGTLV